MYVILHVGGSCGVMSFETGLRAHVLVTLTVTAVRFQVRWSRNVVCSLLILERHYSISALFSATILR